MDASEILKIVQTDGSLFNARYYKDAESMVRHINEQYKPEPPVTKAEVEAVIAPMAIHPGTGAIMDAM